MTQFSDPPLPGGVDPVPYPAGVPLGTETGGGLGPRHEEPPSTTDVAKEQAAQVTNTAVDAGKHVANVAGEQAGQVAAEATHQVKALAAQTRDELTAQAATQQQRVAQGLRSLGTELQAMARGSQNPGMATDLVAQVSERTTTVAAWLEQREPGHVLDEVTGFARRRPGAFLALAAGAGLLAGRLGRGLKAAHDDTDADNSTPRSASNTSTGGYTPPQPTPAATYPPPPGYDPHPNGPGGGYDPAGYQQPPGAPTAPPPAPGLPHPQEQGYHPPPPSYPPPATSGYPPSSGRDLPR